LDRERPSWKPVVHFNIIQAVKTMLDEIDDELSQVDSEDDGGADSDDQDFNEPGPSSSVQRKRRPEKQISVVPRAQREDIIRPSQAEVETLNILRTRLLPLVALHDSLASELSGGVSFSRGLTGVFVRAGWQGLLQANQGGGRAGKGNVGMLVAKALDSAREDVEALWAHSIVRQMVKLRKLRLEESAPL
jgi:hypothetical protein